MKVGIKRHDESIFSSEVYRELERQAVRKGFFKPTEEQLVKLAAQEVQKEPELTGDLVADVAILAENLRTKGYVKQASELERKLVLFKQAEVHLYNVHGEEGEDVLNFAHKDGDVEIVPAQEERGKVETVQSAAKKILEVVQKTPTGKFASKTGLKKTAQAPPVAPPAASTAVGYGAGGAQKVQKTLAALKKALAFPTAEAPPPSFEGVDFRHYKKAAALYGDMENVAAGDIANYYKILFMFGVGAGNQVNAGSVSQMIGNLIKQGPGRAGAHIRSLVSVLGISLHAQFLTGGVGKDWTEEQQIQKYSAQITAALVQGFQALYNRIWGTNNSKITSANQKLKGYYDYVVSAVSAADPSGEITVDDLGNINLAQAMKALNGVLSVIRNVQNSEQYKYLTKAYDALPQNAGPFVRYFKDVDVAIRQATTELAEEYPGALQTVSGQASKAAEIQRLWLQKAKAAETEEEKNEAMGYARLGKTLVNWLSAYEGQMFALMLPHMPSLGTTLGDGELSAVKDYNGLVDYLNRALSETKEATAT
jgi:hypothetical protein